MTNPHFNVSISGPQLAKDFKKLKSLVTEKSPTTKFIAGPDVAGIVEFFLIMVNRMQCPLNKAEQSHLDKQ